jgi:hypothetical protein
VVTSAFRDVQVVGVLDAAMMVAMLAGPLPVRLVAASSLKADTRQLTSEAWAARSSTPSGKARHAPSGSTTEPSCSASARRA